MSQDVRRDGDLLSGGEVHACSGIPLYAGTSTRDLFRPVGACTSYGSISLCLMVRLSEVALAEHGHVSLCLLVSAVASRGWVFLRSRSRSLSRSRSRLRRLGRSL
jgi:hypothetical protein